MKKVVRNSKKNKNFEQWCIENNRQDVLNRWDYELNVDRDGTLLTPKDVSYKSEGLNRKGFWFKCLKNPEHKSEIKRITELVKNKQKDIICSQCTCIHNTHSHLIKFFKDVEDSLKYTYGSNKKVLMICPYCGYEKEKEINTLVIHGFGCNICSEYIPYSEKFMKNL